MVSVTSMTRGAFNSLRFHRPICLSHQLDQKYSILRIVTWTGCQKFVIIFARLEQVTFIKSQIDSDYNNWLHMQKNISSHETRAFELARPMNGNKQNRRKNWTKKNAFLMFRLWFAKNDEYEIQMRSFASCVCSFLFVWSTRWYQNNFAFVGGLFIVQFHFIFISIFFICLNRSFLFKTIVKFYMIYGITCSPIKLMVCAVRCVQRNRIKYFEVVFCFGLIPLIQSSGDNTCFVHWHCEDKVIMIISNQSENVIRKLEHLNFCPEVCFIQKSNLW